MTQPLDRSARIPQVGKLDNATGEFWRENVFEMGAGTDNLSAYEPNRMYLNLDGKQFLDCSFVSGCDIDSDSRSIAAADFDRDGAPDLLVGSVGGGPLRLFANRFSDRHHAVRVNLIGTTSNRFGIGSRAIATVGGRKVVRDLFPANGCLGQAPAELLIGVGEAETIDRLEIRWPDGKTQTFSDLPVDGVLNITEGQQNFKFAKFAATSSTSTSTASSNPSTVIGPDTFKTIDAPRFVAVNASRLGPGERVLGLTVGNASRAYPARYMQAHHLCHDEVQGTPILISYCPPSGSGTAFERRLVSKDKELTVSFDVVGMIRSVGYTLLQDRQTKSLWNPLTGRCVKGKLQGTQLKRISLLATDWEHWQSLNSATTILAPELPNYKPFVTDDSDSGAKFVTNVRTSCPPDTLGVGVRGPTQQLFLPLDGLADFPGGFVAGRLDERKIVVFHDAQRSAAQCFYSLLQDGKTELSFSQKDSRRGRFVSADGSVFDMLGRCRSGPLVGRKLLPVLDTTIVRWYAWSATFPKSYVVRKKN